MDPLRNRLAACIAALAISVALPACGDDDGRGAAEDIERGAEKGADEVEDQGRELDDDLKGTDERNQKDE